MSRPAAPARSWPPPALGTARHRPRLPGSAADAGSATVLVLGLICVVLLAASVASTLGAVAVARHRAGAAADLAALAAAARVAEGVGAACAAAGRVAAAADGRVVACEVAGLEVVVEVAVRPPGAVGRLGAAVVLARAGPAFAPGASTGAA